MQFEWQKRLQEAKARNAQRKAQTEATGAREAAKMEAELAKGNETLGALGQVAGTAIGGAVGGPMGAQIGGSLGGQLGKSGTIDPGATAGGLATGAVGDAATGALTEQFKGFTDPFRSSDQIAGAEMFAKADPSSVVPAAALTDAELDDLTGGLGISGMFLNKGGVVKGTVPDVAGLGQAAQAQAGAQAASQYLNMGGSVQAPNHLTMRKGGLVCGPLASEEVKIQGKDGTHSTKRSYHNPLMSKSSDK